GVDRSGPRPQKRARPLSVIDRPFRAVDKLRVHPQHLHPEKLLPSIHLAPEQLDYRALRAGLAAAYHLSRAAIDVVLEHFDFNKSLREFPSKRRILGHTASIAFVRLCESYQIIELVSKSNLITDRRGAALVHQHSHRHVPSLVETSNQIFTRHSD